ncbi:MAG: glycosyltransferase family 4 protein [Blastocatellia bacterium]|nr:glycosyltransferase family 4 protein [Blastocatellia bacterium]
MSVVKGMAEAGLLQKLVTTVALDPAGWLMKGVQAQKNRLPAKAVASLRNRTVPEFLQGKIEAVWGRELCRILAARFLTPVTAHHLWLWAELGFDRTVARRYGGKYRFIYGMEHSSLETFRRQKEAGGICLLRQVTTHGRYSQQVLERELKQFPQFARHYEQVFLDDNRRSLERKEAEYALADRIVTNSTFVADSFKRMGVPADKLQVVPTGCPAISPASLKKEKKSAPLIFLFAGKLTFLKGIPYLLEAWQNLNPGRDAELWLAGDGELGGEVDKMGLSNVKLWGKVPAAALAELYEAADVLVLPTLLEGLSHVVLEGAAHGLPVLTTRESGGEDILQDGEAGWFFPAADAQVLAERLRWCLNHPQRLPEMGAAARRKAETWTVEASNSAHLHVLHTFLANFEEGGFLPKPF